MSSTKVDRIENAEDIGSSSSEQEQNLTSIVAMPGVETATTSPAGEVIDDQADYRRLLTSGAKDQSAGPTRYFDFLGLPLEIREMIYDLLIVPDPCQREKNDEVTLLEDKKELPYLACGLHLVCRVISIEILAAIQRLPRNLSLQYNEEEPREPFDTAAVSGMLSYPALNTVLVTIFVVPNYLLDYRKMVESIVISIHHVKQFHPRLPNFICSFDADMPQLMKKVFREQATIVQYRDRWFSVFDWNFTQASYEPGAECVKVDLELAISTYLEESGVTSNK